MGRPASELMDRYADILHTITTLIVLISGFLATWLLTKHAGLTAMWVLTFAYVAMFFPYRTKTGCTNHASVLFGQPSGLTEHAKARMEVSSATTRHRVEAAMVTGALVALALTALVLEFT